MKSVPTVIKCQPTSAEVLARLAAEGRPVALACSLGKDSLAAWCALEGAGVEVVPVHFWTIPRLPMVEETIDKMERLFGSKIHQYPHPRWFKTLGTALFQTPERCSVLEAVGSYDVSYEQLWVEIKQDLGLAEDTWIADGVRAADSIQRRASLTKHGVMRESTHKVSPIADWLKAEVMQALEDRGVGLPPDYVMFGRSFDGLDKRFMEPLREQRPEDFEIVRRWYPLIQADEMRWEHYGL